jgi:large subunit ribosomal protein L3
MVTGIIGRKVGMTQRPARVGKPLAGQFKKAGVPPTRVRREVRLAKGADSPKAGEQVLVSAVFSNGDRVDVIGVSRGKGFQGVVRRHHFRGGAATHGSMFHRAPGSIGASSYPSRVIKGMRAAGRMGGDRVTTRNLKVVAVDAENNLLVVHGAVPGAPGGYVVVRKAIAAKPEPKPQAEKPGKTTVAKKGKK